MSSRRNCVGTARLTQFRLGGSPMMDCRLFNHIAGGAVRAAGQATLFISAHDVIARDNRAHLSVYQDCKVRAVNNRAGAGESRAGAGSRLLKTVSD